MGFPGAGQVSGAARGYRWEAYLARGPVCDGLDPATMYKGGGRIVRLVLYAPLGQSGLWRKVAAYQRGWLFGRKPHLAVLRDVVARLDPGA